MKTSELTGAALDWAVAKCEGLMQGQIAIDGVTRGFYTPSTDWAQGGPIIEREGILIGKNNGDLWIASVQPYEDAANPMQFQFGLDPLTAAMRCFCASKLGDEVEIPEELI